jgi:hypothetical protein
MPSGIGTTTIVLTSAVRDELGIVRAELQNKDQRTVTLSEAVHVALQAFKKADSSQQGNH